MLSFLPPVARGVIAASLLGLNTLFWCGLLFSLALVKLVIPVKAIRVPIDRALNGIATRWVAGNSGWMRLTQRTQWDVAGLHELKFRTWYMVNSNHQSWVDIIVLQHLLNRRIPMLKFFLKRQLIYVPIIGLAWWALDFPFMRRHSGTYLKAHPEKRFEDLEATRRACQKFALIPTSVMNFPEGTRFTRAKHRAQHSPYRHLLRPKAGALALALVDARREVRFLARRHDRLSGPRTDLLAVSLRQRAEDRRARTADCPSRGSCAQAITPRIRSSARLSSTGSRTSGRRRTSRSTFSRPVQPIASRLAKQPG